jgi:hypothetical protein
VENGVYDTKFPPYAQEGKLELFHFAGTPGMRAPQL